MNVMRISRFTMKTSYTRSVVIFSASVNRAQTINHGHVCVIKLGISWLYFRCIIYITAHPSEF